MKKILLLIALFFAGTLAAQQVAPRSVVNVKLIVKKESVKIGPYARYAQQYLGVVAPLTDKVEYSIVDANITAFAAGAVVETPGKVALKTDEQLFTDMGITPIVSESAGYAANRTSAREKSLQEMAQDAASTIFTLRKRRFDLVTGDTGPEAFGAGLKAAIDEMSRIENSYLELFLGKKEVSYEVVRFDVVPKKDKATYPLCRFSGTSGVLDVTDQNGEQVVLSLKDENAVSVSFNPAAKNAKPGTLQTVYVPDSAIAAIICGKQTLGTKAVEIYQFGEAVQVEKK